LKDKLERPPTQGFPQQLIPVTVPFITPNLKIGEETFDRFIKRDAMSSQLVLLKVLLKV
jgi:hypothetical protein